MELQSVIDKRNTRNEKNDKTVRDRNTVVDMEETRSHGDDDDEDDNSEEGPSDTVQTKLYDRPLVSVIKNARRGGNPHMVWVNL